MPEVLKDIWWLPLVTAMIGWLTNWVAIRMLFHPRRPIRLLGWHWQGLLPKRHQDLAERVAEMVERELLSQHVIRAELDQLDIEGHLDQFIHQFIRKRLGNKLINIPVLGRTINDATLFHLEKIAREGMHSEIGPLRERLANDLESRLQVREIIQKRIEAFEMDQLEALVRSIARKELKTIEWLGGLLGLIVGLIQVLLLIWLIG